MMARRPTFIEAMFSKKAAVSLLSETVGKKAAKQLIHGKKPGEKAVVLHNLPEASKQLKVMADEGDTTVQALLIEALNDLFKKYKHPPVA
jgi:hypothetical protein